jgi:hypothetical protein
MPRKAEYITSNMRINPMRVIGHFLFSADLRKPVVVVGTDKKGELYVASSHDGKAANSLMTKAIRFIKKGPE